MRTKTNRYPNWTKRMSLLVTICALSILVTETYSQTHEEHDHHDHDVHEEHNHGAHKRSKADHDDKHDDHEDEEHELEVELSAKAVKISGITFDKVKNVKIAKTIELAGEVDFNQEKIAHVVPRFPGIVLAAKKKVGDLVKAGAVLASIESNESLNKYQVKSLISGTVIEKHLTLGEFVSEESTIYVIADLSQVWVDLEVYEKDAELLQVGQKVTVETVGNHHNAQGPIAYIKPVYSKQTRSLIARVILPNPQQKWRPGAFVRGVVHVESDRASTVVLKDAVQTIKEKSYIFVPEKGIENVFRALEVETGDSGKEYVQILSGISLGSKYVSKGAFELKAELATSSLTGHAGHGH